MTTWEAIRQGAEFWPILLTLVGTAVTTTLFVITILQRRHLTAQIKKTEFELNQVQENARSGDTQLRKESHEEIVSIHDRLVKNRQNLRLTKDRVKISGMVLLPFLAGGCVGIGYIMRTIDDLGQFERMTTQFKKLEHALKDSTTQQEAREQEHATRESEQSRMAQAVKELAQEKEQVHARLAKAEKKLAGEKKKRSNLEVLLGKAEQRVADLTKSEVRPNPDPDNFPPEEKSGKGLDTNTETDSPSETRGEMPIGETERGPEGGKLYAANSTSHYSGTLNGQIAFNGKHRNSKTPWSKHRIYVLVRWGLSTWIVTDSSPTVNADGAIEGEFSVILPLHTIRSLDVTAIATDQVYRQYQHVQLPEYQWKSSAATIAVRRS